MRGILGALGPDALLSRDRDFLSALLDPSGVYNFLDGGNKPWEEINTETMRRCAWGTRNQSCFI